MILHNSEKNLKIRKKYERHLIFLVADVSSVCIEESQLLLEAMEGMLIFISKTGQVLYVSDNVEKLIGIPQVIGHKHGFMIETYQYPAGNLA